MRTVKWIFAASIALNLIMGFQIFSGREYINKIRRIDREARMMAKRASDSVRGCMDVVARYHDIVIKRKIIQDNLPQIKEAYRGRNAKKNHSNIGKARIR